VISDLLGEHPIGDGGEVKFRCPFHDDSRPSLRVNPAKQTWYCDPCDCGGDIFDFVRAHQHLDFKSALKFLADRAGVAETTVLRSGDPEREHISHDERGAPLSKLIVLGRDEKGKKIVSQERHFAGRWIGGTGCMKGARRVIYRLPDLMNHHGDAVVVVEGEKDVDRLWDIGIGATCNLGGAKKWRDEDTQQVIAAGKKRVRVIPDNDAPGHEHAQKYVGRSCHDAGLDVGLILLPDVPAGGDVSDYLDTHSKADLVALLKSATPYQQFTMPAAAGSALIAHQVSSDTTTNRDGESWKKKSAAGRELRLDDPEPWPEVVTGDTVLNSLVALLTTFVVFAEPAHADALALWIAHTYLMEIWFISPLLVVNSPTMRCGKTTVLQLVAHLTSRALPASNISPAALFRVIERFRRTLILDEAETFLKDNGELRGLINAGHTRKTAVVIRTVGEPHEPAEFSTWGAKFLALIGRLPGTLMDRAVVIPMRRRMAGEHVERLRLDHVETQCLPIRRQLVRLATDMVERLQAADPVTPPDLDDRAADNWRPLFAIADVAGEAWARRARSAAAVVNGHRERDEPSLSIQLLADIREFLTDERDASAVSSAELVRRLVAREDRPWATASRNDRPLTPHGLARLLKPFDVNPAGAIRIGEKVVRAYRVAAFDDAFKRYLPSISPVEALQRNKPNKNGPELAISQPLPENGCNGSKNTISSITTGLCDAVTVGIAEEGENRGHRLDRNGSDAPREVFEL
jgi:hypothetical protein